MARDLKDVHEVRMCHCPISVILDVLPRDGGGDDGVVVSMLDFRSEGWWFDT